MPPAFNLSQDQTLSFDLQSQAHSNGIEVNPHFAYCLREQVVAALATTCPDRVSPAQASSAPRLPTLIGCCLLKIPPKPAAISRASYYDTLSGVLSRCVARILHIAPVLTQRSEGRRSTRHDTWASPWLPQQPRPAEDRHARRCSQIFWCNSLTMTYFHTRAAHYHRREGVSLSCSGWEGVGPPCYGRQA